MVRFFLFTTVLMSPLLARADDQLTAHQRELLLARLEDLAGRLSAKPDDRVPGGFEIRNQRLRARLQAEQGRSLGGVTLEKTAVSLQGRPELVLAWLDKIRDSRIALTPPCHLRAEGEGVAVRLIAWRVRGDRPDPQATNQDLLKLKENLEWFEKQRSKLSGYINFFRPILDVEAVQVRAARLEKGVITIDAKACDRAAREAFIKELALRAADLSKSIRLDWRGMNIYPAEKVQGEGLFMRDLDPADALLLACEAERAQVIAAIERVRPLSGRIPGKPSGLLAQLLPSLGLSHQKAGGVVVAADGLEGGPPGTEMLPERPVTLQFRKVTPENLFVLLSEVSRVGVVPPASGLTLTVLVREITVRDLAAFVLWALGLVPNGDGKIMAALPPGSNPAIKRGEPGGLDLSAAEAPLSLLVDALAGRVGVVACGEDPPLTMRVRDASKKNLLELLLAGRGMSLKKSGGKTYLVPKGAGVDPAKCPGKTKAATADRLYAVVKDGEKSLALVNDSGRLRWVAEGEGLQDGREMRRIKTSRAVLRGPDRKLTSLFPKVGPDCGGFHRPGSPQGPPTGCRHRLDPTARALSGFRLAGTVITKKRAAAALVDEDGQVFVVRKGHLLGRRCGRVTGVEAGRITVEMGCGQGWDPKVVGVYLRGE
jgi:hypothetical protein